MNRTIISAVSLLLILSLGACRSKREASALPDITVKDRIIGGAEAGMPIPNATIFRMNGDYADNVAVTLNTDGTLAYYPDPSDISPNSRPTKLDNEWYLNRQGVGYGSVFTTYTFDEYSRLKQAPSQEQIMQSIIPGARVTEVVVTPLTIGEAFSDPKKCLRFAPKRVINSK